MSTRVRSLVSFSGLKIQHCCELWCRLAATALIGPLAWEPPYAEGGGWPEKDKRQKKGGVNTEWIHYMAPFFFFMNMLYPLIGIAAESTAYSFKIAISDSSLSRDWTKPPHEWPPPPTPHLDKWIAIPKTLSLWINQITCFTSLELVQGEHVKTKSQPKHWTQPWKLGVRYDGDPKIVSEEKDDKHPTTLTFTFFWFILGFFAGGGDFLSF